jgi:hypothetical protein
VRRTFVDGSYVAAILVGQAFLENLLGGLLSKNRLKTGR